MLNMRKAKYRLNQESFDIKARRNLRHRAAENVLSQPRILIIGSIKSAILINW